MRKRVFFAILPVVLWMFPLNAAIIATKGYVDSGLATRVRNAVFDAFQNREDGFATATQGTKADSAYQKPSDGIPKTDLANAVQTSLGKADTSVQPAAMDAAIDTKISTHNALDTAHAAKFADYRTAAAQDTLDADKLLKTGGTMTGVLNVPTPTLP
jgi:hypothetical protein